MVFTKDDLDLYSTRLSDLVNKLDPDSLRQKIVELEKQSADPNLWSDEQKAKSLLQELSQTRTLLTDIEKATEEIKGLKELAQMEQTQTDEAFEAELSDLYYAAGRSLNKLELFTYLSEPYDKNHAILSIHSGQGGTEAMDWTSMLDRMYRRFFERRGWGFEMVDQSAGEEAGLKSVTYLVRAPFAFGYLKNERGTHRLVRLSPFNADNLRQTSFAGVEVTPLIEDSESIKINPEDLEFEATRSSGAGGQNVNKVSTAVRIRHIPTGLVVTCQSQRHQEQNRKIALQLLQAKLWEIEEKKRQDELSRIKGEHKIAGWGNQIRSYVLHPYKLVKDLRTEVESTDPDSVLDGDLDLFIDSELKHLSAGRRDFASLPSSAKLE